LPSIFDSHLQPSCRIPAPGVTLDSSNPRSFLQNSPFHRQEISSQGKALKAKKVGGTMFHAWAAERLGQLQEAC
jgi:hypothetical protein